MQTEQLIWRLGVSIDVMNAAAKLDCEIRQKRERLLELCLQERELALEQRIEVRRLNRSLAERGLPPVELPAVPNRIAELEVRVPGLMGITRHAPASRPTPPIRLPSCIDEDGPVIVGLVAPFSEPTRVADPPTYVPYVEELLPGSVQIPRRRVPLVVEDDHEPIGVAIGFTEKPFGLFARLRLFGERRAWVLAMVRSGFLTGLGPVFAPLETVHEGALVVRRRMRLNSIAVCRYPAYRDSWLAIEKH